MVELVLRVMLVWKCLLKKIYQESRHLGHVVMWITIESKARTAGVVPEAHS